MSASRRAGRPSGAFSVVSAEHGSTTLEFALIAPILLGLVLASIEAGRFVWFHAALDYALADTARRASLDPSLRQDRSTLAALLSRRLEALGAPPLDVEARLVLEPAPCGERLTVHVPYRPALHELWPATPQLTSTACLSVA
ncbi:MAG: pilus assembly protein [Sphingomonadaceae bacterium]|uniref:TadE/TadG family type IV pilus assembly protein n=1 Tax=Thermaurantiacus sp. TaxID=2820283 RepID=UPI00298F0DBE|nr:TadE family protein [Thermaurantiacus sp.]MCS6987742.1 pilus assembly protein [Sphingomonadaceae bacterium]MDW8415038.1 pilus assembly protein [Thermaurantiacus sp.]